MSDEDRIFLRLVRGKTTYGQNRFIDNGDGTITDEETGLMWMQEDSGDGQFVVLLSGFTYNGGSMNWGEALGSQAQYGSEHLNVEKKFKRPSGFSFAPQNQHG